jgi:cell volume regulation protein A
MTWLVQIVMFLSLGLLVNPSDMMSVILEALVVGAFLMLVARPVSVVLCLLPWIKEMNPKAVTFISWVGLRGAVPIIFATYPVAANIPGSEIIFNIVFFITLLSLLVQGTTIPFVARKLKLDEPLEEHVNSFGVELPEETGSYLTDLVVTPEILSEGERLMNARLPKGALVVLVRRGDDYQVPNGQLVLENGDVLLLLQREEINT